MSKAFKPIVVALLTLSFLVNATIVWTRLPKMGYGDFVIFYTGAQIIKDGAAEHLYDLKVQTRYQQKLDFVSFFNPDGIFPYNHPPYELLPFMPLTYLSFQSAYVLWAGLSLLLLVFTCMLVFPYFPREHRFILAAIMFTFVPAWIAILRGQDSLLSLLLLTAVFLCLKAGREASAGCLLGLGLYKPQLVLPIAILLSFQKRWIPVRAFLFTGAVVIVISIVMVGLNGAMGYLDFLAWINEKHYAIYPGNMANVHGFVEALLGLKHPGAVSNLLILALSFALFIWCAAQWRGEWEPEEPIFDLKFAHLIVITLLISYHAYVYDLVLLALALVLSLRYAAVQPARSVLFLATLLAVSTVFCFPLILHVVDDQKHMPWVSLLILLFAGSLSVEIATRNPRRALKVLVGDP